MTALRQCMLSGWVALLAFAVACNQGQEKPPAGKETSPSAVIKNKDQDKPGNSKHSDPSTVGKNKQENGKQPAGKGIDAATVSAYQKLGAIYGGWPKGDITGFQAGRKQAESGLPGFRFFKTFPKTKLPEVAVTFGLFLHFSGVTDAGLKELAPLLNLTILDLYVAPVTDAGLKELAPLKNLTTLSLYGTPVTDAGLKELASLKNLTSLNLGHTQVTNAGLKDLAPLKNLTTLDLSETKVTAVGVVELRKALPNCKITR